MALTLVVAAPVAASAHDELTGSDPSDGSSVDSMPQELTLTFSGVLLPDDGATEVQATDADGLSLTDGAPVVEDNIVTQALTGDGGGRVTVLWRVASSDGHPISGEYAFTVVGATTPTPTPTRTPAASASPIAPSPTTSTPSPTESALPAADSGSAAVPWIILGVVGVAVVGGVSYLLVSRSRRQDHLDRDRPASSNP